MIDLPGLIFTFLPNEVACRAVSSSVLTAEVSTTIGSAPIAGTLPWLVTVIDALNFLLAVATVGALSKEPDRSICGAWISIVPVEPLIVMPPDGSIASTTT